MRRIFLSILLIIVIVFAVGVFSFGFFFGKLRYEFRNASLHAEIKFVESYGSSLYGALDNDIVPANVIVKLNRDLREGEILYAFIVNKEGRIIHGSTGAGYELARSFTDVLQMDERFLTSSKGVVRVIDIRARIDDEHSLQIGFPAPEKNIDIPFSIIKAMLVLFLPGIILVVTFAILAVVSLFKTRKMKKELQKKDRLAYLGEISGGLAHELKNPLNTVKMNIQLIEEDVQLMGNQNLKRKINRINRELNHLANYLMNFLQFARTPSMKISKFDLNETINQVVTFFAPECTSSGITIKLNISQKQLQMRGDQKQIKQVLLNLLLNAKQASQKGSSIFVSCESKGENAILEIEDHGAGIPKDNIDIIFTPFFTTKKGGTGIGMSVVRRIIEDHAGKIAIESKLGKGTKIKISIPKAL